MYFKVKPHLANFAFNFLWTLATHFTLINKIWATCCFNLVLLLTEVYDSGKTKVLLHFLMLKTLPFCNSTAVELKNLIGYVLCMYKRTVKWSHNLEFIYFLIIKLLIFVYLWSVAKVHLTLCSPRLPGPSWSIIYCEVLFIL